MESRKEFRERVHKIIKGIGEEDFVYDESEFWMVQSPYEYIEYYAIEKRYINTAIALKLARGLHNGTHRKSKIMKDGVAYRLPYLIHPLLVCRMLVDLHIPLSPEDEDILLAAALCHDMIEDIPFEDHGIELYTKYHLNKKVYETVKYVSKRKDFTLEEEKAFFHNIETHELALLIKLSDRGHNVEDLYNMSWAKVHEYIQETYMYFIPMCDYALKNYPERLLTFEILKDKIVSLTEVASILVDRYSILEQELEDECNELRKENEELRTEWKKLWKE